MIVTWGDQSGFRRTIFDWSGAGADPRGRLVCGVGATAPRVDGTAAAAARVSGAAATAPRVDGTATIEEC